jgi:nitroreductase
MRESNCSNLDPVFLERWSPRAFSSEAIDERDLHTLLEAARWSPSCFNEQPWRFVYAHRHSDLDKFRPVLSEANQVWASSAPLLILVFSKKSFTLNGKPNRWAEFDTGAAWMALALQALKLGLRTHCMGGFDTDKAYSATGVNPDVYHAVCAIAVGKPGDIDSLPSELREREMPSERKSVTEIAFEGMILE